MSKLNKVSLFIALFLGISLWILLHHGILLGGDSERYLTGAKNILEGLPLTGKQPSYRAYIALVALCLKSGIGSLGLGVVQVVLSALSLVCLFKMGKTLSGARAGWIATLLVALNPEIQRWNFFILTESVYISSVIISCWVVMKTLEASTSKKKFGWGILAIGLFVFTAFVRPNGWVTLVVVFAFVFLQVVRKTTDRVISAAVLVLCLVILLTKVSAFQQGIQNEDPSKALTSGLILWGYPAWNLSMPVESNLESGFTGLFIYVVKHPLAALALGICRLGSELIHARPFYSRGHNLAITLFLVPVYAFALRGFLGIRHRVLAKLLASLILAQFLTVAATFSDWDGRFLLYVLPLIAVFCGVGLTPKPSEIT